MTHLQAISHGKFFTPALSKRMLFACGLGLAVITFFVISAGSGNASWGPYWRVKPLLLTPALAAVVGLCYDVTQPLRNLNGWAGRVFLILSCLGFVVGMWISLVLGLAGTMWN